MRPSVALIHDVVAGLDPLDGLEAAHIADTLRWMDGTDDVFRRAKPATPARHLVSYAVLIDPDRSDVLLVDHRNAGLFLPPGGHVEPDEHPAATARRECREELGIDASFRGGSTDPSFLTVTTTIGRDAGHTDVSLWYVMTAGRDVPLTVDDGEFRGARWWSRSEIDEADPALFDPHFHRFLDKVPGPA